MSLIRIPALFYSALPSVSFAPGCDHTVCVRSVPLVSQRVQGQELAGVFVSLPFTAGPGSTCQLLTVGNIPPRRGLQGQLECWEAA